MSAIDPTLYPSGSPPRTPVGDDGPRIGAFEMLSWLAQSWRLVLLVPLAVGVLVAALSFLMTDIYTARTTLLPPGSTQQSNSASALAALGALGALGGGVSAKTPDELYAALLRSDTLQRALAERFHLLERYDVSSYERLRRVLPTKIRVTTDKKTGLLMVEVDDPDPKFAAELANAHVTEITRLLGRLAVSEAQQRRVFFDNQLNQTKEALIKAEQDLRAVQEKSGVIVLDKQAESLISSAARLRAQIVEREVQLRVLLTGATPQNPSVLRLNSELAGLRAELNRMESAQGSMSGGAGGNGGSGGSANGGNANALELPAGRLADASVGYVRARREVRLQESLLESMVRQFEIAKLDEAKEGPVLQQVDVALPPDARSKPARLMLVIGSMFLSLVLCVLYVLVRRYLAVVRRPQAAVAAAR